VDGQALNNDILPTFDECAEIEPADRTPLQAFVWENSCVNPQNDEFFRKQLRAVIEAERAAMSATDKAGNTCAELAIRLIWMARRPDIAGPHADVAIAIYEAAKTIDFTTYQRMCLHSGPIITLADIGHYVEEYISGLTERQGHEKSVMLHVVDALKNLDRENIGVVIDPFERTIGLHCQGSPNFAKFRYYYPGEKRP